jgi:hypothetical protein
MSQNRSARRHVQRSAEEKAAFVSEWERGELTAQAFERQRGLSRNSLWRWKRDAVLARRDAVPAGRAAITFAPVHITKAPASAAVDAERVIAEVVLGREVRVRVLDGADTRQVSLLVRALVGGPAC